MKFIYVMESTSGLVKIGVSKDVLKRRTHLENQSGFGIKIVAEFGPFNAATRLEKMAHEELKSHRAGGEWFAVSAQKAVRTLQILSEKFSDTDAVSRGEHSFALSAAETHLLCTNDLESINKTSEALHANGMGELADRLVGLFTSSSLVTRDFMHDCQIALMEKKFNDLLSLHNSFKDEVQMYLPGFGG